MRSSGDDEDALAKAVERQERLRVTMERQANETKPANETKQPARSPANDAISALQRRIDQKKALAARGASRAEHAGAREQDIASPRTPAVVSPRNSDRAIEENTNASQKSLVGAMKKDDSKKSFQKSLRDVTEGIQAELIDDLEAHREKIMEEAKADIISKAVVAQVQEDSQKTSTCKQLLFVVLVGIVILAAIAGGVCGSRKCSRSSIRKPSQKEIIETINSLSLSNKEVQYPVIDREALTPEEEALQHVVENVPEGLSFPDNSWQLAQRYALCVFLYTNGYWDENRQKRETAWFARTSDNECSWSGVSCAEGRVVELNMKDTALVGTLPSDLGLLTDLTILNLADNKLEGNLPSVLKELSNLQVFDINDNEFTGSLFPSYLDILQLKQFIVKDNFFSGSIPSALGTQTQLDTLDISYNKGLGGSVPTSLALLTALTSLSFGSGGVLTGTLPSFIQNLTDLRKLAIEKSTFDSSENQLLSLYTELTQLTHLRMASIMTMEQTIPSVLGEVWPNMENFEVIRNKITGTLPSSLAKWTALKVFAVLGNEINGTVPHEYFESWPDLVDVRVGENMISGTLPTTVGLWSNLEELSIEINQFTGTLPTTLGVLTHLAEIYIGENRFTGTIPVEALNIPASAMDFSWNNFTGTAPFCQNGETFHPAEVDCDEVVCPCCKNCDTELR